MTDSQRAAFVRIAYDDVKYALRELRTEKWVLIHADLLKAQEHLKNAVSKIDLSLT